MEHWKKTVEDYLVATLRYSVTPEGKIIKEEFYGEKDEMGLLDHILDVVQSERKRCYKRGFLDGVKEVVKEDPDLEVEEILNQKTAESKFNEWDK